MIKQGVEFVGEWAPKAGPAPLFPVFISSTTGVSVHFLNVRLRLKWQPTGGVSLPLRQKTNCSVTAGWWNPFQTCSNGYNFFLHGANNHDVRNCFARHATCRQHCRNRLSALCSAYSVFSVTVASKIL
ncbi:hypothetical protein TNCV_2892691 [Trichonephila clavipes]|nr:hypothetical protein TNCV_2892691 [Trichonephila clavipes]